MITLVPVNVHEAKTHLSKLLDRVAAGERIVIAKAGVPVAVLSPIEEPPRRTPGNDRIVVHPDFDEPLEELDPAYEHAGDPLATSAE